MTGGYQKFIENNNCLAIPYTSYGEWYRDIFYKQEVNTLCMYEKYLFVKFKFDKNYNEVLWNTNNNNDNKRKVETEEERLDTFTYDDNWNHKHIKYAVLLHPKEVNKVLELNYYYDSSNYDTFLTNQQVTEDYYSHVNELILCCKKRY